MSNRLSFAPDGDEEGASNASSQGGQVDVALVFKGGKRMRKKVVVSESASTASTAMGPPAARVGGMAQQTGEKRSRQGASENNRHEEDEERDWKPKHESEELIAERAARAEAKSAARGGAGAASDPAMNERDEGNADKEFEYAYYDADEGQGLSDFKVCFGCFRFGVCC